MAANLRFNQTSAHQKEFRRIVESGGMGKGIANWLLCQDTTGALSLLALVLPPEVATPVHDHLAWGLVGPVGTEDSDMDLKLVAQNRLFLRVDPSNYPELAERLENLSWRNSTKNAYV